LKTKTIILLIVILSGALLVFNQTGFFKISSTGFAGPYSGPGATPSGTAQAYCPQTSALASISSPPTNCFTFPLQLKIYLTDLDAQAPAAASTYSVKFYINVAGAWQPTGDVVACGAAPTSCLSSLSYGAGTNIGFSVCKNQTPSCSAVDYAAQKTRIDCQLPAVTATAIAGGLCGQNGPGAGIVPFSGPCSSVPCTQSFTAPIRLLAGQAYANNSPDQISISWQNGTAFTSSATCFVSTGANACDLPKATSTGRLAYTVMISTGTAGGTAPAAPYGAGYATFTPFDPSLQSPAVPGQSRGALQMAWVLEIKATTGTDMCIPTSPVTVGGNPIQPKVIPKSGSATDIFYVYILPDNALTRIVDSGGNVLSLGAIQTQLSYDCSQVYNGGSTDVVTLTNNIYTYFSMNYFTNYFATNPEVPINSSSGLATNNVVTIKQ
jgi:hypothetical protein